MQENRHPRDRRTGRYVHEWGVIGEPDSAGHEQVDECQVCGKVRIHGVDRLLKDRETARHRLDVNLLEGY